MATDDAVWESYSEADHSKRNQPGWVLGKVEMKMKKLMIAAAAALWATVGMADVESNNIVGYQDFNGTGGFTLTVPTFINVGTDGSGLKLGDLKAGKDFVAGADAISLYNGGELLMKVTFYPYDDPDDFGIPGGWYELSDFNESDEPTLLNDMSIPFGTGFAFSRVNAAATITYAGEVKLTATTLPSTGGFTLCGNVAPMDLTLAQIFGNDSFVAGADAISLYKGGELEKKVTFYPYDDPDDFGIPGGWYELNDFNESDEPTLLNNTPIAAGQGFAFSRVNAAARIIVDPTVK